MESLVVPKSAKPAESILSPGRGFVLHLWAFFLPLLTTAYLLTGPHPWQIALLWTLPIWVLVAADWRALGVVHGATLRSHSCYSAKMYQG